MVRAIYPVPRPIGPLRPFFARVPMNDGRWMGVILMALDEASLRLEWNAVEVMAL